MKQAPTRNGTSDAVRARAGGRRYGRKTSLDEPAAYQASWHRSRVGMDSVQQCAAGTAYSTVHA